MAQAADSNLFNNTGILHLADAFVVLVKTEWNPHVVDELERGCLQAMQDDYDVKNTITITVPGAVEIPFAIKSYWENAIHKPDAFIALGCVIKGDTPHFDYVCQSVNNGVLQLNLTLPVPVVFGVLTVNTAAQAEERIGGCHGHKGKEAAITALKMIKFNRSLKK